MPSQAPRLPVGPQGSPRRPPQPPSTNACRRRPEPPRFEEVAGSAVERLAEFLQDSQRGVVGAPLDAMQGRVTEPESLRQVLLGHASVLPEPPQVLGQLIREGHAEKTC